MMIGLGLYNLDVSRAYEAQIFKRFAVSSLHLLDCIFVEALRGYLLVASRGFKPLAAWGQLSYIQEISPSCEPTLLFIGNIDNFRQVTDPRHLQDTWMTLTASTLITSVNDKDQNSFLGSEGVCG